MLFCTVTKETYYRKAVSEYEAKKNLATELGYPIDTIEVWGIEICMGY
jgi:hypothetical protein